MRSTILLAALAAVLPGTLSAPASASDTKTSIPLQTAIPKIDAEGLAKIAAEIASSSSSPSPSPSTVPVPPIKQIPTSTLLNPASSTEMVYIEPPPIFDPAEPRPDTIFDAPSSSHPAEINPLRPPPIPLHRMEHMSPFDGAHAHPDDTPYRPGADDADGDGDMFGGACGFGMQMLRLVAGVMALMMVVYCGVALGERVLRCCTRGLRSRRREGEGQIRLDETTVDMEKGDGSACALAEVMARSRSASKATQV